MRPTWIVLGVVVGLGSSQGFVGRVERRLGVAAPLLGHVERLDERELGLLGIGELATQPFGFAFEHGPLLVHRLEPAPNATHLGVVAMQG
jgi:hypothetical protein